VAEGGDRRDRRRRARDRVGTRDRVDTRDRADPRAFTMRIAWDGGWRRVDLVGMISVPGRMPALPRRVHVCPGLQRRSAPTAIPSRPLIATHRPPPGSSRTPVPTASLAPMVLAATMVPGRGPDPVARPHLEPGRERGEGLAADRVRLRRPGRRRRAVRRGPAMVRRWSPGSSRSSARRTTPVPGRSSRSPRSSSESCTRTSDISRSTSSPRSGWGSPGGSPSSSRRSPARFDGTGSSGRPSRTGASGGRRPGY